MASEDKHLVRPTKLQPMVIALLPYELVVLLFLQVHPLSDLQGMCSKKAAGALWNVLGSFNKCYHPDEHHLNMVEVTLTATLEDDVTCHDAEHSRGVLFDLIEAGVQSAASTKHVSTVHEFTCNVSSCSGECQGGGLGEDRDRGRSKWGVECHDTKWVSPVTHDHLRP
jgi:hypothetical protein